MCDTSSIVTDSRKAAPPASIAINSNSRPPAAENRVPCVFCVDPDLVGVTHKIELFPFNERTSLGTKFLPGSSTKLQCGMSRILSHKLRGRFDSFLRAAGAQDFPESAALLLTRMRCALCSQAE